MTANQIAGKLADAPPPPSPPRALTMTREVEPRLMTRTDAAAYCAVTPSRFYQLVKAGTLPAAIPGTTRYDRIAIDRALDKLSGLTTDAELSPYQKWKQARDGSRAA